MNLLYQLYPMKIIPFTKWDDTLPICFSLWKTPFGNVYVASTPKWICSVELCSTKKEALERLKKRFPKSICEEVPQNSHRELLSFFHDTKEREIIFHVKGTPFQLKVWHALLTVPFWELSTYKNMALYVKNEKAVRAVGTAIGKNPIVYFIPCHRIIQTWGGMWGYYRWLAKKQEILNWEKK